MGTPPLVAIVGRPNVGKSTLFNRMIRRRQAVVDDQPGVTRDRIYARAEWAGRTFRVVDTGGLVPDSKDPLEIAIHAQADVAIQESLLILFVVDVETGPTDLDVAVAAQLRRSDRPVVLVVNKVDNEQRTLEVPAFYQLGLGDPRWVSAISGRGTGDLLDVVVAGLPPAGEDTGEPDRAGSLPDEPDVDERLEEDEEALMALWESDAGEGADEEDVEADTEPASESPGTQGVKEEPESSDGPLAPLQIAVLGRPNVGKSSFVNAVYGSERVIVSEVAGTTRDPADIEVTVDGRQLTLVDTAGLRRRTRVKENVEYYSALRAYQSLDRCDVALLIVDAVEGITHQEARLLERILVRGKAAVLLVNKWDLIEKETGTAEAYEKRFREEYPFAYYVPVLFLSALTGQRVERALQSAIAAGEARRRRVRTSRFNTFLAETVRGRRTLTPAMGDLKVSYALQSGIEPPTFLFFVNDPKKLKPNFRRFLERRIRQAFELDGTPVRLRFRAKA